MAFPDLKGGQVREGWKMNFCAIIGLIVSLVFKHLIEYFGDEYGQ